MLFTSPEPDARELEVLAEVEDLRQRLRHQLREPRRWYGSLRRLSEARQIQSVEIVALGERRDQPAPVARAVLTQSVN